MWGKWFSLGYLLWWLHDDWIFLLDRFLRRTLDTEIFPDWLLVYSSRKFCLAQLCPDMYQLFLRMSFKCLSCNYICSYSFERMKEKNLPAKHVTPKTQDSIFLYWFDFFLFPMEILSMCCRHHSAQGKTSEWNPSTPSYMSAHRYAAQKKILITFILIISIKISRAIYSAHLVM